MRKRKENCRSTTQLLLKKIKEYKRCFLSLLLIVILTSTSLIKNANSCGIEFAGKTNSTLISELNEFKSPEKYRAFKSQYLKNIRNLKIQESMREQEFDEEANQRSGRRSRRTNKKRKLDISITECALCMKIKFDFNALDTYFSTDYPDLVSILKYLLDEETGNTLIRAGLNSLFKLNKKSLYDLNGHYCYDSKYVLSEETLFNQINYDLFFIPIIDTENLNTVANKNKMYSKYCVQDDQTRRPIMAIIAFSPYFLNEYSLSVIQSEFENKDKSTIFNKIFNLIFHQVIHMMGFHYDLFPQYSTSAGNKYSILYGVDFRALETSGNLRKELIDLGKADSSYYYTNKGLFATDLNSYAKNFYRCDDVANIPLPLEAHGGRDVAQMHWDAGLFLGELMTADTEFDEIFLSQFTYQVLLATGWYKKNKNIDGGKYIFGKNGGCDFFKGSFFSRDKPKFHYFCDEVDEEGCSPNGGFIGKCNMKTDCSSENCNESECGVDIINNNYNIYNFFSNSKTAGDYCYNHNIPFYKPQTSKPSKNCRNLDGLISTKSVSLNTFFGDVSYFPETQFSQGCFYHNINIQQNEYDAPNYEINKKLRPDCFNYKCDSGSKKLYVCTNNDSAFCYPCESFLTRSGQTINEAKINFNQEIPDSNNTTNHYQGYIICPPYDQMCSSLCKTIFQCIFMDYESPNSNALPINQVSEFKSSEMSYCCKSNGKSINCSNHEFCIQEEDVINAFNIALPCCNESMGYITRCSTFDNCIKSESGFPCTMPFLIDFTSSHQVCNFPRPICNTNYWSTNCSSISDNDYYAIDLPVLRKCSSTINKKCVKNAYIKTKYNRILDPCPDSTTTSPDCYLKNEPKVTSFSSAFPKIFECLPNKNSYFSIYNDYICSNGPNKINKDIGIEYDSRYNSLCNNNTKCITAASVNYDLFTHEYISYITCEDLLVDKQCIRTNDPDIDKKYGEFSPHFCCPNGTGISNNYLCVICSSSDLKGVILPYIKPCSIDSTNCYSYPTGPSFNLVNPYASKDKYICLSNFTSSSSCKTLHAENAYVLICQEKPSSNYIGTATTSCTNYSTSNLCTQTILSAISVAKTSYENDLEAYNSVPVHGPSDQPPTYQGPRCVKQIKKCAKNPSDISDNPDLFCKYDFNNDFTDPKRYGKCENTIGIYCSDMKITYCCPDNLDEYDNYVNKASCEDKSNQAYTQCLTSYLPCCNTTAGFNNSSSGECILESSGVFCIKIFSTEKFISKTTVFLPVCSVMDSTNYSNYCIKIANIDGFVRVESPTYITDRASTDTNTSVKTNGVTQEELVDKYHKLICCSKSTDSFTRKKNCYEPLNNTERSAYCKMLLVDEIPICDDSNYTNNLNCNTQGKGIVNTLISDDSKIECCMGDFVTPNCMNYPNCIIPPCCDYSSTGTNIYDKVRIANNTYSSNCKTVTVDFENFSFPTNCTPVNPCCTGRNLASKDFSTCTTSVVCIPPLLLCNEYNSSGICAIFDNAASSDNIVNNIYCKNSSQNCKSITKFYCQSITIDPNTIRFDYMSKSANISNFANYYISSLNNDIENELNFLCNKFKSTTMIPSYCPKIYSTSSEVSSQKNCIYLIDESLNISGNGIECCYSSNSNNYITIDNTNGNVCFKLPSSEETNVLTNGSNKCYGPYLANYCCYPKSNTPALYLSKQCSIHNDCASIMPCCDGNTLTNPVPNVESVCSNNTNSCISRTIKCTNDFNLLGQCANFPNSKIPSPCDININKVLCIRPLQCCDSIHFQNCSNLSNCISPLPTCDANRGNNKVFLISDDVPCLLGSTPLNLSQDNEYYSVYNVNPVVSPYSFEIKPCCYSGSDIVPSGNSIIESCTYDRDYCIAQMKCCYKTYTDSTTLLVEKSYVFKNTCSNLKNCYEAGPCKCTNAEITSSDISVKEKCKYGMFIVPSVYDVSDFCYSPIPYCGDEINTNSLFNYRCCSTKVKTNCIKAQGCANLKVVDFFNPNLPVCNNFYLPNNVNNCIKEPHKNDLIEYQCCSDSIKTNCLNHDICGYIGIYSLSECVDRINDDNCKVGPTPAAFCCDFTKANGLQKNCVKISSICKELNYNSLSLCTSTITTNCYVGSFVTAAQICTTFEATNCIRLSSITGIPTALTSSDISVNLDVASFKLTTSLKVSNYVTLSIFNNLTECDLINSPYSTECYVLSHYKKEQLVSNICCDMNSTDTLSTNKCIYSDSCNSLNYANLSVCANSSDTNCLMGNILSSQFSCCNEGNIIDMCIKVTNCTSLSSITLATLKGLQLCTSLVFNNCYVPRTTTNNDDDTNNKSAPLNDIFSIPCCNSDYSITTNCIYHESCYNKIVNLDVCIKGEVEDNCLQLACDNQKLKGIGDNLYPCCGGKITTNCSTLDNCIQPAPCEVEGLYVINDTNNYHPVNTVSTASNCFYPRPCCKKAAPEAPNPIDCDQTQITNDEALTRNAILLKAYTYFNSIITEDIEENYNSTTKTYIYPIGLSIKELKQKNLVHKCIASDSKRYYPCCSSDDPILLTQCHYLSNCVPAKKCKIDIFLNDYNFSDSSVINVDTEDARNCFKPRPCCSSKINSTDHKCSSNILQCIAVSSPCCGTGIVGKEVVSDCHSLPNCIFPKPCCKIGSYSLQTTSITPDSYPPPCNNLANCYPARPCCNVNTVFPEIQTKKVIHNFDKVFNFDGTLKKLCPFGYTTTQDNTYNACNETSSSGNPAWFDDLYPSDCRKDFGQASSTDPIKEEFYAQERVIVKKTYINQPSNDYLEGDSAKCIPTLRCCDSTYSVLCHNLTNCHGYVSYEMQTVNNVLTKIQNVDSVKCCTELDTTAYQCTLKVDHPLCKKGLACCNNPLIGPFDAKINDCDDEMTLISNNYDPNSLSNCVKTNICCSPNYLASEYSCSSLVNCYPKAYPYNSEFKIHKTSGYTFYHVDYDAAVNSDTRNAYIGYPCCESGYDSTIDKVCSLDSDFCIPPYPCCSDEVYRDGLTTNMSNIYGCVDPDFYFNCLGASPKCIKGEFELTGCTDYYNYWDPVPCPEELYDSDGANVYGVVDSLSKYIWTFTDISKNCISRMPCCTENYSNNCHNLSNCYEQLRMCIEKVYENDTLAYDDSGTVNTKFFCSKNVNAIYPTPCCNEKIQDECVYPDDNCDLALTNDCGCVPALPCCDYSLGTNMIKPCHNLINCVPAAPCCVFRDNFPSTSDLIPTQECSGCKYDKFSVQDDPCCSVDTTDPVGCTTDKTNTLEYNLCYGVSSSIKTENDAVDPNCLDKLPLCKYNDFTKTYLDVPDGCSTDTSMAEVNNRPCCESGETDIPEGCNAADDAVNPTNCKLYKPYCSYKDYPYVKFNECSTAKNCILFPKPCCLETKLPYGCTTDNTLTLEYKMSLASTDVNYISKPPCCLKDKISNGPSGCVVLNNSNNCNATLRPCCVNNTKDKPLGCLVNGVLGSTCYEFYPICTSNEDPLNCSEDSDKCLPQMPCCDQTKLEEYCSNKDYKYNFTDLTTYDGYPYCTQKAPQCVTDIYEMEGCSTFSNAYYPTPCCDEVNYPTVKNCSLDSDTCIKPAPCCNSNISKLVCHLLANCEIPKPKCTDRYNITGCGDFNNSYDPVPCCDGKNFKESSNTDTNIVCREYSSNTRINQCISAMTCCLSSDNGDGTITQIASSNFNPNENCHNLPNCYMGNPICDCKHARYMRNDCIISPTDLPNYQVKACCGSLTTDGSATLQSGVDDCSVDSGTCKQPGICCSSPANNKYIEADDVCEDNSLTLAKIHAFNCDLLPNCEKPGPKCIEGKYFIKDANKYSNLWNGAIQRCSTNSASFNPYVCGDSSAISLKGLDNASSGCIPKLPCCVDPLVIPDEYPCHNLVGCVLQNKFCCSNAYNLNCVNLDVDTNLIPIIDNPVNIYCKEPQPCCDENLTENCVKPNTLSLYNSEFKVDPDNCIVAMDCCELNSLGKPITKDGIQCHNLANCIKTKSNYYEDQELIENKIQPNTTISKANAISNSNSSNKSSETKFENKGSNKACNIQKDITSPNKINNDLEKYSDDLFSFDYPDISNNDYYKSVNSNTNSAANTTSTTTNTANSASSSIISNEKINGEYFSKIDDSNTLPENIDEENIELKGDSLSDGNVLIRIANTVDNSNNLNSNKDKKTKNNIKTN